MKIQVKFFLTAIILNVLCSQVSFAQVQYQPSNERKFDLLHTDLKIKPEWETQHLIGTAILTIKPYFYNQSSLTLDAKSFDIKKVILANKELKYTYDSQKITIDLGKEYAKADTLKIQIEYIAKPNDVKVKGSDAIVSDKGLYFINPLNEKKNVPRQLWTQGETEANSCWFPTIDSPNEKHTQDIYLTVEKGFTTLSNGLLLSSKLNSDGTRTDHWQQKLPHSVYLTMIAAGNFKKVVDPSYKKFEVSYYVEPEYEKNAIQIFGRTPEMIAFYEKILGVPYAWDKYAQIPVREYVSGAMENTTATIHGKNVLKNEHQLVDETDDGVIAHELFHHWFGDLVTCESWSNLPLNESFADYSEYLWTEFKHGKDEADLVHLNALNQYLSESQTKQLDLIRYYYHDKEDMFDAHSYSKGGRVLHMLRKEVGDEAFFKSLNLYLNKNRFKTTELSDLRTAFEEVTGRDLNWFFDQWFLASGHPRLRVATQTEGKILNIEVNQILDSTNARVYSVPLKIEIGYGNRSVIKELRINQASQTLSLDLEGTPSFVNFNPDNYLLGVIDYQKPDSEYFSQFELSKDVAARLSALEYLTFVPETGDTLVGNAPLKDEKIRALVLKALKDPFWKIRQIAIQKLFDYDGEDFLEVEKALQFIIKNESKSQVKASAILAVKNFLNPQNDILFRAALADTSYMVKAAALEAILINKPQDADKLVANFANIKDVNIFSSVAAYYASKPSPDNYEWFIENLDNLDGGQLYQVMGIFGTYLVQSPKDIQLKSVSYLSYLSKSSQPWFVKFASTQALSLLSELPEAKAAMKSIIATETDPRLVKYYEYFK